jgi:hypothetical protein
LETKIKKSGKMQEIKYLKRNENKRCGLKQTIKFKIKEGGGGGVKK